MTRTACRRITLGVLLLGTLAGCGPGPLKISVRARPETNQGRPMYLLLRSVDPDAFFLEPYSEVAAKVVAPDASVLRAEVLYPGSRVFLSLPRSQPRALGIYGLFTSPGSSWRRLVRGPFNQDLQIEVLANELE